MTKLGWVLFRFSASELTICFLESTCSIAWQMQLRLPTAGRLSALLCARSHRV